MSDKIEIQGKTVEAAVSEALLRMGARRDEVEIKVLEEPKSGFMGFLGGRAAKVLVRKKRSRGRGGSGQDFRVDDNDHQGHNLSGGRSRGSRRRPSGGSGGSGGSNATRTPSAENKDSGREDRSRSRRGSRGRGGRGRSQEAAGGNQGQGQQRERQQERQQERRDQPVKAERQDRQPAGRSGDGRSRNERSRRGGPGRQDGRQDNRPDNRQDNRPDNRSDNRQDSRPQARSESRSDNRPDNRRDSRPARQENVRAASRPDERPSTPVEGARNQRREAPAPVAAPAPVEPVTPIIKKEEISVATPKKQKKGFGGLGSRLRERKAAEKAAAKAAAMEAAAPAESPAASAPQPAATPAPAPTYESSPAPSRDYSSGNRGQGRRSPSRQAEGYADELVLGGISGVKYATPVGEVTDEGLDDALTELTDGLLARAGFPCRCETHPGEYRQIKVTTDDASAGMLIGRHGQAIDAVEHLVERMASNAIDARARINLDINNYRQRREESLAERVQEAAASIQETGRPVHLEPMSARERRLVHMEAANIEGLRTFTMDRSGGKHVVIAQDSEATGETETPGEQPDYSE